MTPDELRKNIDTIVIVMMENRSFDHLLGTMQMAAYGGRTDVEGIDDLSNLDYANPAANARMIHPFLTQDRPFLADLPHERDQVATQLAWSQAAGYTMTGFVRAYEDANPGSGTLEPPPMGLLTPDQIPVSGFLAREFMVCDHWFAPIPTSTHPNRMMALAGYTVNDRTYSKPLPSHDLVLDWLGQRNVRWRVYSAGLPFLTLMPKMWLTLLDDERFRSFDALALDAKYEADATFPQVILVEPDYHDSPIHSSGHGCDNHPPLPVAFGETFVQHVYQAVTANPRRWAKTLLVITYDEHGGFYDHVAPCAVACPPPPGASYAAFESTGPRVPAVLVSPWAARRRACQATLDHTSMLQLLAERFDTAPYSPAVDARRAAGIASLSAALDATLAPAPPPALPAISLPVSAMLSTTTAPDTDGRRAFATAVDQFAQAHGAKALARYPAIAQWQASRGPWSPP